MRVLIRLLQAWIAVLTTDHADTGHIGRWVRGALLVPAFGFVLVVLHLRMRLRGPLIVEGRACFGGLFRCNPPDLIQMYILLFGVWEPDLSHLIDRRLQPGDVFVDVGANIGYYSLLAARRVGPDGGVVAIDALPTNFTQLQRNLERNGISNVHALNRAVADAPGRLDVFAGPSHNVGLATTAPGERKELAREASILAAPLADLLEPDEIRRARLVKIDVEGAEPGVIAGMGDFLRHCREDVEILLELSPAWWDDPDATPETVLQPLRAAGFNSYTMDNNYWPWRYLWPAAVRAPKRVHRLPDERVKRIDLVLSRVDAEYLS